MTSWSHVGYAVGAGVGVEVTTDDTEGDKIAVEVDEEDDEAIEVAWAEDVKVVDDGTETVDVAGVEVELEDELVSLLIDVDAVPLVLDAGTWVRSTGADEDTSSDDVTVDEGEGGVEAELEDAAEDDDEGWTEGVEVGDAVAMVDVAVDIVSAT